MDTQQALPNDKIIGIEPKSDFTVSSCAYKVSMQILPYINELQNVFNSKLKLSNYSKKLINYLTIIYIVLPENWQGAAHPERKYYKRSDKHFYIDIRFPDYEAFCNADEKTALKIMAEQTLRGAEKFLSKVKDFDYQQFSADLKEVLAEYL